jgi:hypothetical protein
MHPPPAPRTLHWRRPWVASPARRLHRSWKCMLGGDFARRGAESITMAAEAQTNHQVRPMTLGSESQPKQAVWLRLQASPCTTSSAPASSCRFETTSVHARATHSNPRGGLHRAPPAAQAAETVQLGNYSRSTSAAVMVGAVGTPVGPRLGAPAGTGAAVTKGLPPPDGLAAPAPAEAPMPALEEEP